MNVEKLMNGRVVSVTPAQTAADAAKLLKKHNIGSVVVRGSDGRLKGIVTDRDIIMRCIALGNDPNETSVNDLMSRNVVTVPSGADVREAAAVMAENKIRRLPVTDGGELVGMISIGDIAKARVYDMEAALALAEISEKTPGK